MEVQKLCSKPSINGRAYMKTYHCFTSGEDLKEEEKGFFYGLRENPRKSFRVADPEFHSAIEEAEFLVQDRESETESMPLTRKRSYRNRSSGGTETHNQRMKSKKPTSEKLSTADSKSEPSPEEEIALSLLMLSRDKWGTKKKVEAKNKLKLDRSNESTIARTKSHCKNCKRSFRSYRALRVHNEICFRREEETRNGGNQKIFQCPFCDRVFGSGQALGGHKRSHLLSSASAKKSVNVEKSTIDLNLPAAVEEEDDYSVVSDA